MEVFLCCTFLQRKKTVDRICSQKYLSTVLLASAAALATACSPQIHSVASKLSTIANSLNPSADHLIYLVAPSNAGAGSSISPAIQVEFLNQQGQVDTSINSSVTLAIGNNPGAGALSGTVVVSAVNGIASFSGLGINNVGSGYTLTASASGVSALTSAAFNISAGTPTKLAFTIQPASAQSGASLGGIAVAVEDAAGNVVTSSSASITLAIANNAGPGGNLSGTLTVSASSGIATFPGLNIDIAGTGYTLGATASSLTGATSGAFNISAGNPTQLVWGTQPSNATGGASLGSITVSIEDAAGNVVTSATDAVTLAIGNNAGPGGTLSGTLTVNAVSGVASFSGLSVDVAGTGYTLTAADGLLTGATSNAFNITIGSAAKLAFTTVPASAGSSAAFTVKVTVEDAGGNKISGSTASITVAIANNAGPGGVLSGTTTISAVAGVATFSTIKIDIAGVGYTLGATSTGLTAGTSTGFTINAGTATQLAFTTQPSSVATATSLGSVQVSVEDAAGNVVTSATNSITVAILNNAGPGASLSGTKIVSAVSGVATFSTLTINLGGTGYTLKATATGLSQGNSAAFNINFPTATTFTWSGSSSPGAGACVAYTVKAKNGGSAAAFATSTVVSLTGGSPGSFYGLGDTTCASGAVTSVTFPANTSSETIYYKDPSYGLETLTATASTVTGSDNITSMGQYAVTSVASSTTGTPVLVTITIEDSTGAAINANANMNFATVSSYYYDKFCLSTDPTCAGSNQTMITVPSGSSSVTFYYVDNRQETAQINLDDQSGYLNGNPYIASVVMSSTSTSGQYVITGPTFPIPGTCSTYTVTPIDTYRNVTTLGSAETVTLSSSSANGHFYGTSDTTCSSGTVTSISLALGSTGAKFYYIDTTDGDDSTLSATSTGFTALNFAAHARTTTPTFPFGGSDAIVCAAPYGNLKCWGDNTYNLGALGNTSQLTGVSTVPIQVTGLTSGVTSFSGGGFGGWSCATVSGVIECWGFAGFGAMGDGSISSHGTVGPVLSSGYGGSGATGLSIGAGAALATCALVNGGAYCTGDNIDAPTLGNGTQTGDYGTFQQVPSLPQGSGITAMGGANSSTCVIISGGLQCWGGGNIGSSTPTLPTSMIAASSGVTAIAGTRNTMCAVVSGGLRCSYAFNGAGPQWSTYIIAAGSNVTKIAGGYNNFCAVVNGGVQCAGDNTYGQIGTGTAGGLYNVLTQVVGLPAGSGVIDVETTGISSCALLSSGEIKCWGSNYSAMFGNGTITDSLTPTSTTSIY
jgi:hypothetical protein